MTFVVIIIITIIIVIEPDLIVSTKSYYVASRLSQTDSFGLTQGLNAFLLYTIYTFLM